MLTGAGSPLDGVIAEILPSVPAISIAGPTCLTRPCSHSSLVLALMDERWPSIAALDDSPAGDVLAKLASDPRYLVGRLQQAMTVLLADNLPPVDPQSALLSQALDDALAWRTHQDRRCPECGDEWRDDLCDQCTADYDQANRYHELARALGVVGDIPSAGPEGRPDR
jgi:hypothetical protein